MKGFRLKVILIVLSLSLCMVLLSSCHTPTAQEEEDINVLTYTQAMSPVPEELESILKPQFYDLLGKSRKEIRSQFRMETSEGDYAFWYGGLGMADDFSEGNVFISYNIDGMTYEGLCDYISGEIERISVFGKGTTFEIFERETGLSAPEDQGERFYRIDNFVIFADPDQEDPTKIIRLTVKDQPK